jgi:hypothetical protein
VEAGSREQALESGAAIFTAAASRAGLPAWPISAITAVSEDEDPDGYEDAEP